MGWLDHREGPQMGFEHTIIGLQIGSAAYLIDDPSYKSGASFAKNGSLDIQVNSASHNKDNIKTGKIYLI